MISVGFFSTFSLAGTGLDSGTLFDLAAMVSFGASTVATGAAAAAGAAAGVVVVGAAVAATGGATLAVLFTVGDVAEPSVTGASSMQNERTETL